MSLVYLGYHEMGCMGLRTLLRLGVPVSAVFTYDDDPGENPWFDSVAEIARGAGIETHTTQRINDKEWVARIAALEPDVVLSVYYRHMVGKRVRAIPRHGAFNLHGSLLPKYRGRAPLNWQVVHGERICGVTLHHMVRRADAGDIVDQERVELGPDETAFDLLQKLLRAGERLLERRIHELMTGRAPRTAQVEAEATLFGGRGPEDGRIDWQWPARRIHDLVRAVTAPWPGAFWDGPHGRVMLWRTRVVTPDEGDLPALSPGELRRDAGGRLLAGTGDGVLELLRAEPVEGARLEIGGRAA